MQALRSLALGLARAAIWPLYLILLAYAARVAPWPRSLGILVSAVTDRCGDRDPRPRPAALADRAVRVAGALPGRAPRRGAATGTRRAVSWSWRPSSFCCRSICSITS